MKAKQLRNKNTHIDIDVVAEPGQSFGARGVRHNLGSWFDSINNVNFESSNTRDNPSTSMYQPGSMESSLETP